MFAIYLTLTLTLIGLMLKHHDHKTLNIQLLLTTAGAYDFCVLHEVILSFFLHYSHHTVILYRHGTTKSVCVYVSSQVKGGSVVDTQYIETDKWKYLQAYIHDVHSIVYVYVQYIIYVFVCVCL